MSVLNLEISAENLKYNFDLLKKTCPNQIIGAVVKANAYGLGIKNVVPVLAESGCQTFFVNSFDEGVLVRSLTNSAEIFVLDSFIGDETLDDYKKLSLTPVFSTIEALNRYPLEENIAVRLDVGFNLAGLNALDKEVTLKALENRKVSFLMGHLSCSEQVGSPVNKQQRYLFLEYANLFPSARKSLSASFGVNLGQDYLFDVVRIGAFLYGSRFFKGSKTVAKLSTKVGWIRSFNKGDSLGYNHGYIFKRPMVVASLLVGHGDGVLHKKGCFVDYKGKLLPVLTSPSTNYMAVEVTNVQDEIQENDSIDLFNAFYTPDDLAKDLGIDVGADIMIQLNSSFKRIVV